MWNRGCVFENTAQQMTLGGLALLVVAAFRGELSQIDVSTFSTDSLLALALLTIFGSVTGFGAYVWLLRNTSPAVATSYAYVNPLVALVFGSVVADEPFGRRTFFAGAPIIATVVLLVTDAGCIGRTAKSDSTGG